MNFALQSRRPFVIVKVEQIVVRVGVSDEEHTRSIIQIRLLIRELKL